MRENDHVIWELKKLQNSDFHLKGKYEHKLRIKKSENHKKSVFRRWLHTKTFMQYMKAQPTFSDF